MATTAGWAVAGRGKSARPVTTGAATSRSPWITPRTVIDGPLDLIDPRTGKRIARSLEILWWHLWIATFKFSRASSHAIYKTVLRELDEAPTDTFTTQYGLDYESYYRDVARLVTTPAEVLYLVALGCATARQELTTFAQSLSPAIDQPYEVADAYLKERRLPASVSIDVVPVGLKNSAEAADQIRIRLHR